MQDTAARKAFSDFLDDIRRTTDAAADVVRSPDQRNTSALRETLARTLVTVARLSAAVEHRPAA